MFLVSIALYNMLVFCCYSMRFYLYFRMNRKPSLTELMRRKSIPAAAPVLMSSAIERCISIEMCLRTENLYMDNENNMIAEKPGQIIQENTDASVLPGDVPSM